MSDALRRSLPAGVVFILLVLAQCVLPQTTDGYRLPDTGQTKCYDDEKEIPCPNPGEAFYGQDAQYEGPQMAYLDNGDGTVTDLNTGLIWQQGDDQNDSSRRPWQEAVDYCADLHLASHSDWRLPTCRELMSLVDYSIPYPGSTINTGYFPSCRSDDYWSSTTEADIPVSGAWRVNFEYGHVHGVNWNYGSGYVRCVRSGA